MIEFVCINVPHFLGHKQPGRNEGDEIRASGFVDRISATWVEIEPDYDQHDPVVAVNLALAEAITSHATRFPIVLAGDCVSALGMVKGLAQDNLGIVWYDAHGDFNTPETTPSGFLGGMPLAILVGRGNQHLMASVGLEPIPENHILFTDGRDLDPEEGENLRASEIAVFTDVNALLTTPLPTHPVYIHLDVDIVDPQYMPALGYPAPNGPTPDTIAATLQRIARDGNVAGLLVSLWNRDKATDDLPLRSTLKMVEALVTSLD